MKYSKIFLDLLTNYKAMDSIAFEKSIKLLELLTLNDDFKVRTAKKELLLKLRGLHLARTETDKIYAKKITVALPWNLKGMNIYLQELLFVDHCLASNNSEDLRKSDLFFSFGYGKGMGHIAVEKAAKNNYERLFRLEYGFISSEDIALKDSPQHSIIICPEVMYYDAIEESAMERDLNSEDFLLSKEIKIRVENLINQIIAYKTTKYNHAPIKNIESIKTSKKPKVLLIDQRFGDASIKMGLASEDSFELMWKDALALTDHDIYVKLHPDAISGGKESCLSRLIPKKTPKNVHLLKDETNPYSVIEDMDKVFVCVSQMGFEALLMGKEVHTYGMAFYSGWGLTVDKIKPIRPRKKRSLLDVFYIFYIEYSRYFIPHKGLVDIEEIIPYLSIKNKSKKVEAPLIAENKKANFLLVIPSGRFGATGRYFQEIAKYLKHLGHDVMVICEANETKFYEGIRWIKIDFDGFRLKSEILDEIKKFNPKIVLENGVRSRAQRAAIEIALITKADIICQSEDDDIQVYKTRHPNPNIELLKLFDKTNITHSEMKLFLKENDWEYSLNVLAAPSYDRWVEPCLRAIINHMAVFHTAIWYPYERRLKAEFQKPTYVIPPVIDIKKYSYFEYSRADIDHLFSDYGINSNQIILFLGGTVYDYSPEFEVFLEALKILANRHVDREIVLVTVSGRTNLELDKIASNLLDNRVKHIDLGNPNDDIYMKFLQYSDLICSPGLPDDFNLYRLPSRLVKAMAIGKTVLTTKIGFGESLLHGKNAILIDGSDPSGWADSMELIFNKDSMLSMGKAAREFAITHFDVKNVIDGFISKLKEKNII